MLAFRNEISEYSFSEDNINYVAFFTADDSSDSEISVQDEIEDDIEDDDLNRQANDGDNESDDIRVEASEENENREHNGASRNSNQNLFQPEEELVYSDENVDIRCQKIPFKKQKKFAISGKHCIQFLLREWSSKV